MIRPFLTPYLLPGAAAWRVPGFRGEGVVEDGLLGGARGAGAARARVVSP